MKTDDFINALVEDQGVKVAASGRRFGSQMGAGLGLSLAIFVVFLGVRHDFAVALSDPHVMFKFIFAASLVGCLLPVVIRAVRPEVRLLQPLRWVALPLVVLGAGVAFQLLTSAPEAWLTGMIGQNPGSCLKSIPALAVGPLVVLLLILRNGAPTRPVLSGAVAGIVSGGFAAFIYALHCPDDSALFVALWYSLAIGITALAGALLGNRFLRW